MQVKEDVKKQLTLHSKGTSDKEGPRTHIQGKGSYSSGLTPRFCSTYLTPWFNSPCQLPHGLGFYDNARDTASLTTEGLS